MSRSFLRAVFVGALIDLVLLMFSPAAEAHIGAGMVVDREGRIFFLDTLRNRVWKIDVDGRLTLLAEHRHGDALALGADGNIYCEDVITGGVWKITPDGAASEVLSKEKRHAIVGWTYFLNVAPDGSFILVTGYPDQVKLLKMLPSGESSVLAGSFRGTADGLLLSVQFREIRAAAWGTEGSLFLIDANSIRRLAPDSTVTTIAGSAEAGFADGTGPAARFRHPTGLHVAADGTLFVADFGNRRIRKVTPAGEVSTVTQPFSFWTPAGVALAGKNLYVLERFGMYNDYSTFFTWIGDLSGNPRVRRISSDGRTAQIVRVWTLSGIGWTATILPLIELTVLAALIWFARWLLRRFRRRHLHPARAAT